MKNRKKVFAAIMVCFAIFPSALFAADSPIANAVAPLLNNDWQQVNDDNALYHAENTTAGLNITVSESRNLQTNLEHDWNEKSDQELKELAETTMAAMNEEEGIILEDASTYRSPYLSFLTFTGEAQTDGKTHYFTQYITVNNGGAIQFTITKESAPLTAEENQTIRTEIISKVELAITERSIDKNVLLPLLLILGVVLVLIASVIIHVIHYRRKQGGKNGKNK